MTPLNSLFCLLCSFVTCFQLCEAAPTLSCPNNKCYASPPSANPLQVVIPPLGTVVGKNTGYGAQRFTLPYAQAPVGPLRFASPQPLTSFNGTGGGVYDASQLPKECMQEPDSRYGIADDGVSEDCLCMNVYRPSPASSTSKAAPMPVMVWIHGGSFISGSSTAPGLDGSYLATQNNIIVITIQYRLGMFGFFSPSSLTSESLPPSQTVGAGQVNGNQGIRDAIAALQFIHDHISSFGGDPNTVTVAGQSSGAHLIRVLLSSPSAAPLFKRAILHSDPANFGTQTLATSNLVSQFAMSQTSCSDLTCLRNMSANDLLEASDTAVQAGQAIDPSVAVSEVWRPFIGSLTGPPLESNPVTSAAAVAGKQVMFTNVENEGGSAIGSLLLSTGSNATSATLRAYPLTLTRAELLDQMFNDNRSFALSSAVQYGLSTSNTSAYPTPAQVQLYAKVDDSLRRNLETILTQGMFVCPSWNNALRYPEAYVALFERGITYPSNAGIDYCADKVCHEDDILLVFSDPSTVASSVRATVKEVQARWVSFVRSGNPNTGSYGGWGSVGPKGESKATMLRIGAYAGAKTTGSMVDKIALQSGQYAGCGQVWGSQVEFDWQLYG